MGGGLRRVLPDGGAPAGVRRTSAVVDVVLVVVADGAAVLPEALVLDRRVVSPVDLVAATRVDVAVEAVVHRAGVRRSRATRHSTCDEEQTGCCHHEGTTTADLGLVFREH